MLQAIILVVRQLPPTSRYLHGPLTSSSGHSDNFSRPSFASLCFPAAQTPKRLPDPSGIDFSWFFDPSGIDFPSFFDDSVSQNCLSRSLFSLKIVSRNVTQRFKEKKGMIYAPFFHELISEKNNGHSALQSKYPKLRAIRPAAPG
jgi:hypothetical protein